ncbi:DinB family protein [Lacibacter sp. H375]|uniref:DinB family protein n=1 Tax=Lacibacter sp. H375 TaxID=3133424 RepID=UPI0030C27B4E
MKEQFDLIRQTRARFIDLVNGLSIEELNEIPAGMNNNIAWNFGHIITAQQGLCNGLSGVELDVPDELTAGFKKGTKPEGFISQEEIEVLKEYAMSCIDELEKGLSENVFVQYKTYTTSYGYTLNNIEDAVRFVMVHDALHLGYAMAIRRNLSKK